MKRILVIDGQGGKIGRTLLECLSARLAETPDLAAETELYAVGANSIATANMLKGASGVRAATGENAIAVTARKADIIAGPLGIIIADAMLGEITDRAACAVSSSDAVRILIPMNRTQCDNIVVGVGDLPLGTLIEQAADEILRVLASLI